MIQPVLPGSYYTAFMRNLCMGAVGLSVCLGAGTGAVQCMTEQEKHAALFAEAAGNPSKGLPEMQHYLSVRQPPVVQVAGCKPAHAVQAAVQCYSAALAPGDGMRPVALQPTTWSRGAPVKESTAPSHTIHTAMSGAECSPDVCVGVLTGLIRVSNTDLIKLLDAGVLPALLHAASQPVPDDDSPEGARYATAILALAGVRSLVHCGCTRQHGAPRLRKEHRERLMRPAEDRDPAAPYLAACDAMQVVVNLALHHPDVWLRRSAAECLEAMGRHQHLGNGRARAKTHRW